MLCSQLQTNQRSISNQQLTSLAAGAVRISGQDQNSSLLNVGCLAVSDQDLDDVCRDRSGTSKMDALLLQRRLVPAQSPSHITTPGVGEGSSIAHGQCHGCLRLMVFSRRVVRCSKHCLRSVTRFTPCAAGQPCAQMLLWSSGAFSMSEYGPSPMINAYPPSLINHNRLSLVVGWHDLQ